MTDERPMSAREWYHNCTTAIGWDSSLADEYASYLVEWHTKGLVNIIAALRLGMPECQPWDEDSDHCACAIDKALAAAKGTEG